MGALWRLFPYVRRYRRTFVLGLLCSSTTTAITLVAPRILQGAVDDLTAGVTRAKLLGYGGALLAVGLVGGLFRFWTRRLLIGASRHIEYDMRNEFFAHLQRLPLSYFQAHRTGDLMSRATNDLNAVRMMIGPSVMYSSNTVLTFVAALVMMLAIDTRLTMLSLIPLPFVSISVKMFGSAIHRGFEKIQEQLSEVSAVAQEALSGVRVVRAYRQEEAEIARFECANQEYLRRNRRLIAIQGFFFPSMTLFLGLGGMLVLWLGSRDVISGRITLGEFVAFNAYLTMLAWPMIAFGWVTNMLQRGMASWKRMLDVLDSVPAIADSPQSAQRAQSQAFEDRTVASRHPGANHHGSAGSVRSVVNRDLIRGEIEFRHLTFGYATGQPVLKDVSAHIPAGTTCAIIGLTGSGKSTLISLLVRLHEPPRGAVFVDGSDVLDLPLAVLRGAVGMVPQEPFLFSDTIGDNVAFGLDAQGAEGAAPRWPEIEKAAAVARLDKDLSDFPKGYDTLVGERGITLSGGQKQRTAIARAVVIDTPILVLDDSFSAVDTYTEQEILTRLSSVMQSRTSIIVSHRISTVRRADQILVLDQGAIVERGTHDALVAHHGLYAALHRKQLLEDELAAS